jgi:hypothetical protein
MYEAAYKVKPQIMAPSGKAGIEEAVSPNIFQKRFQLHKKAAPPKKPELVLKELQPYQTEPAYIIYRANTFVLLCVAKVERESNPWWISGTHLSECRDPDSGGTSGRGWPGAPEENTWNE